jgi:hypothetical protein
MSIPSFVSSADSGNELDTDRLTDELDIETDSNVVSLTTQQAPAGLVGKHTRDNSHDTLCTIKTVMWTKAGLIMRTSWTISNRHGAVEES